MLRHQHHLYQPDEHLIPEERLAEALKQRGMINLHRKLRRQRRRKYVEKRKGKPWEEIFTEIVLRKKLSDFMKK